MIKLSPTILHIFLLQQSFDQLIKRSGSRRSCTYGLCWEVIFFSRQIIIILFSWQIILRLVTFGIVDVVSLVEVIIVIDAGRRGHSSSSSV